MRWLEIKNALVRSPIWSHRYAVARYTAGRWCENDEPHCSPFGNSSDGHAYHPKATRRFGFQSLLVLIAFVAAPEGVHGSEPPLVRWAGISFAGDAVQVPRVYSNCYAVYQEHVPHTQDLLLEKRMRELLSATSFPNISLALPSAAAASDGKFTKAHGQKLAMTLAVDGEHIEIEELGGVFAIRTWLSAQLLVFDFEEAEIKVCYPVGVMLSSARPERPTQQQIIDLVRSAILGDGQSGGVSLLAEAATTAARIRPQDSSRPKTQLSKITIAERALSSLPEELKENQRPLKYFISNTFAKALSAEAGISILPYIADEPNADGNKLIKSGGTMSVLMRTLAGC